MCDAVVNQKHQKVFGKNGHEDVLYPYVADKQIGPRNEIVRKYFANIFQKKTHTCINSIYMLLISYIYIYNLETFI